MINALDKEQGIERLLDYGNFKRVAGIFLLEQLYLNKGKYDFSKSFNENIREIFENKGEINFTEKDIEEISKRYKEQVDKGAFQEMLKEAIEFFKGIKEMQ